MPRDHYRASALPTVFACPGSALEPSTKIDTAGDAARVGRAVHEALRELVWRDALDWQRVERVAEEHGAAVGDVRGLCAAALKLWPALRETFFSCATEAGYSARIDGVTLEGHVDMVADAYDTIHVGDWKTGRKDSDYAHQMKAYAVLALADSPGAARAVVTVVWIRDGDVERYTLTRADAGAWIAAFRAEVLGWDGRFRPGPHCAHCPRAHECDARTGLVRRDAAALLADGLTFDLERATPDEVLDLYRKASMVAAVAERVRNATRALVAARGDVVGETGRLTLVTEERRSADTAAAWPVLEGAGFGDQDFAAVVDISLSRAEDIIAKRAGRGNGAGAVREFRRRLAEAGAVKTTEIQKLTERRK